MGTPTRIGSAGGGSHEWEPLASRVLTARGLMNETASAFLEPSLRSLHDPSLLPDLDRAAERILEAVASNQTIAVYGDYDVDGVSATAILVRTLRAIAPAARVLTYIPHRIDEGYGLNADAIRSLAGEGARVIVSVDCGITATGPALAAREVGVDLIITDHHNGAEREEDLPRAFAIVHPRRPGSAYPFGDLCGAGVAYKLAWRLCTMHAGSALLPADLRELLVELLSLAALGVIADVVPLRGENRVLARHGLSRIKASPFIGLRALVKASGLDGERIDTEGVGFSLAPRLNACGRLGHAREALELMLTEDAVRAAEIARALTKLNDERRGVERRIAEEALEMARACGMAGPDRRAVVLAHEDWHAGVVGIVCSRLVEKLGLKDRVHFIGRVDDCDVPRLMRECTVFVHPNRVTAKGDVEGFGIVFLEASACGLPVVGGRTGGTPDSVSEGVSGYLIDPDDLHQLESVLTQLLSEPQLRQALAEKGRQFAQEFTWKLPAQRVWQKSVNGRY